MRINKKKQWIRHKKDKNEYKQIQKKVKVKEGNLQGSQTSKVQKAMQKLAEMKWVETASA